MEKTSTGRPKSSLKYFAKEKLGKYYPLSQETPWRRPLTKRQKKDANKTLLEQGKNEFKDYAYQIALTHVEYVDRATRGANPIPPFDYQNDKTLKKLKTFWLGYSDVKTKILHPDWIENVVIDHEDNVRILSPSWVAYAKQENCNNKNRADKRTKKEFESICNKRWLSSIICNIENSIFSRFKTMEGSYSG